MEERLGKGYLQKVKEDGFIDVRARRGILADKFLKHSYKMLCHTNACSYTCPVGGIPHVPQPGSRGFSAGRGNAGHLPHQQQQPIGAGMGSSFNFPSMETPNSQPSPGGPLSQPGFVSNMTQGASQTYRDGFSVGGMSQQDFLGDDFKSQGSHVQYNVGDLSTQASQGGYAVDYATPATQAGYPGSFLNHNSQAGFSRFGAGNDFMSQDYMGHGSQGLFTQVGFKDPSQDESSQSHFSGAAATSLHTQGVMNPLYSQPFTHYNSQPLNVPPQQQQQQQQQQAPGQTSHYNG